MADLTKLTAELAGMKQKMVDRLVAQGDETIQPDDTMQTIVDHFDNLRTKIVNQDKEITANGEYTADEGYTGLGKVTVDVKGEPLQKYGVTVDAFLGDVDGNGKLQKPTEFIDLYFTGVQDVGYSLAKLFQDNIRVTSVSFPDLTHLSLFAAAQYMFAGCSGLTSASLPNLTTLNYGSAGGYMFQNCTNLTSFNLNNLMTISGNNSAWYMFYGCKNLTMANLPKLKTISGSQSCDSMFYGCTGLKSIDLSALESVNGGGSLNRMFQGCTGLTSVSFPSLTTIVSTAMASSSTSAMFYQCNNLTEIHFRADAQSTIEAVSNYSSKFGATNATIYFDL